MVLHQDVDFDTINEEYKKAFLKRSEAVKALNEAIVAYQELQRMCEELVFDIPNKKDVYVDQAKVMQNAMRVRNEVSMELQKIKIANNII